MKTVKYNWDKDVYLIHVEAVNQGADNATIKYFRVTEFLENSDEETQYLKPGESRRFIVSKKSLKEISVTIACEKHIGIKVFKLLDRAYLPTDTDLCEIETL